MNKREAKRQSVAGVLSIGELRQLIDSAATRGGMSKVNPQFTLLQACEIYRRSFEAHDDEEIPGGSRYSASRRSVVPNRDSRIIYNILRDCA